MTVQLLSIETSSIACSVAILQGADIFEHFEVAPQQHSAKILPMCQALLSKLGLSLSQLDAIAVGHGPGSFTGVRLAISVGQGLAYGANRPVVGISSLQALAQAAIEEADASAILTAMDARMQAVYWAAFENQGGIAHPCNEAAESMVDAFPMPTNKPWTTIGDGFEAYPVLAPAGALHLQRHYPRARYIAKLAAPLVAAGEARDPAMLAPLYLRDPVYSLGAK